MKKAIKRLLKAIEDNTLQMKMEVSDEIYTIAVPIQYIADELEEVKELVK